MVWFKVIIPFLASLAMVSCGDGDDPVKPDPDKVVVLHTLDDMDLSDNQLNSHKGEEQWSVLQPVMDSYAIIPHSTLVAKVPASATEQKTAMYPRIKKLANGSYIMFYHGGQVASRCFYTLSYDLKSWTEPVMLLEPIKITVDGKQIWQRYGNPDAVVMPDGEVLAVFSFRDDNYSNGRGGGLALMRSSNHGVSWSGPTTIYEGQNWEPYLLLLPDGRLQCYFTDCNALTKDSGTSVITSSDGGRTWSAKSRCCRLYKYKYDGPNTQFTGTKIFTDQMPSFRVLNDGKTIAGFLEARLEKPESISGTSYYVMSMVYNDGLDWKDLGEENAGPQRRNTGVVNGAGGYISVFPSGETVLSCNIEKKFSLKLGNCTATEFNGSDWNADWLQPFANKGFWGSTEVINPHMLVGAMHTTDDGMNIERFYLNHRIDAAAQKITLDGSSDEWKESDALYLSNMENSYALIRAAKDGDNLYLAIDRTGIASMSFKLGKDIDFKVDARGLVTTSSGDVKSVGCKAKASAGQEGTVTEISVPLSKVGSEKYLPLYAEIAGSKTVCTFTFCTKSNTDSWQQIKL